MNGDRMLGEQDGMMKSIAPSRGGELEEEHALKRAKLLQTQYNIVDMKRGVNVKSDDEYESGYADD